ncbi:DUF1311 domain-containing protein [Sutcliffiella horikoshii]|uniref:lysozyme inhibitor LprI family protein n=1 Tax=Sutcliffiella horikoshii TaxID=79883 RepID=UPI00384DC490
MQNKRKIIMVKLTLWLFILAACGTTTDQSGATQNTNDDSSKEVITEKPLDNASTATDMKDKNETNEEVDVAANEKESATNEIEASMQEKYLQQFDDTKKETEEWNATDSSTYALKKVENDRWELWDELLNEIYSVLNDQLPSEEMNQLREEQRNWIKYRDDTALEASLKFKGGTQEHLEYVAVLANLTEERCYELVANRM